jgi:hypothetical protein
VSLRGHHRQKFVSADVPSERYVPSERFAQGNHLRREPSQTPGCPESGPSTPPSAARRPTRRIEVPTARLGTIENIRLVLASFGDIPPAAYARVGTSFMAHLRSNLDIRFPRTALATLPAAVNALQASALFVKGRHKFARSNDHATFHLQSTASGLGAIGGTQKPSSSKRSRTSTRTRNIGTPTTRTW